MPCTANKQGCRIKSIAALGLQCHIRTLDRTIGGQEFDIVAHPVVDFDGVMVQGRGLGVLLSEVNWSSALTTQYGFL